jgi:hypothetical protein
MDELTSKFNALHIVDDATQHAEEFARLSLWLTPFSLDSCGLCF